MLVLENIPLALLGLIPGLFPLIVAIQEPINLLQIGAGYLLSLAFPTQFTLIWLALLF